MYKLLIFFLFISLNLSAQITGTYVFHKNQREHLIRLTFENQQLKAYVYSNEQRRWNQAEMLRTNLEEKYFKFKNRHGVIYHAYVFDERLLLLIDLHGNTWRYSKQFVNEPPVPQPGNPGEIVIQHDCVSTIPNSDFNNLVNHINELDFDKTKLSTAKSSIRNTCISAEQAAKLTSLMSFEDTKLDFAKYAYQFTFDKHNYHYVFKVLEFSKSADELSKFINQK
ncbi:MAG: DUF4476 domain-containing protein [Bacteroidia bacterium]